jgi:hypothetical protein
MRFASFKISYRYVALNSDERCFQMLGCNRMGGEGLVIVLLSWSCLLGVQPASVDKDHDRVLHGKPLSDEVFIYFGKCCPIVCYTLILLIYIPIL